MMCDYAILILNRMGHSVVYESMFKGAAAEIFLKRYMGIDRPEIHNKYLLFATALLLCDFRKRFPEVYLIA